MPGVRTQNRTPPSRTCRPSLPLVRCYVTIFLDDISCQVASFCRVRQVTIRLKLASSTPDRTLRPRSDPRLDPVIPLVAPTCALERSSNGSRNHPAPTLGRGPRCDAGTQPSGDPRYAGHYRRVRESAGGRPDPELPGGVLSDHPRFPPVAADAAGRNRG